jgi:hypothetical protein
MLDDLDREANCKVHMVWRYALPGLFITHPYVSFKLFISELVLQNSL